MSGDTGSYRLLHTMIRVKDLDKSIAFYVDMLGMKVLRRRDVPEGKYTLAFVGYGDEAANTVIELTHNWDHAPYNLGDGFGHIALGVKDIYGVCKSLGESGVKITRPPGPMKHGTTVIAFIEDPEQKIGRPRQLYTGPAHRPFVPLDKRA